MSETDWTVGEDGRSNTSKQFKKICGEVESLIRDSSHSLINGKVSDVARLIVANLAQKHNMVFNDSDTSDIEERINSAAAEFKMVTGKRPTTFYLGAKEFAHISNLWPVYMLDTDTGEEYKIYPICVSHESHIGFGIDQQ